MDEKRYPFSPWKSWPEKKERGMKRWVLRVWQHDVWPLVQMQRDKLCGFNPVIRKWNELFLYWPPWSFPMTSHSAFLFRNEAQRDSDEKILKGKPWELIHFGARYLQIEKSHFSTRRWTLAKGEEERKNNRGNDSWDEKHPQKSCLCLDFSKSPLISTGIMAGLSIRYISLILRPNLVDPPQEIP